MKNLQKIFFFNLYISQALPVITKSEPVKIDLQTLSLIKTLTKKLPEKPENTLFSDDEVCDCLKIIFIKLYEC